MNVVEEAKEFAIKAHKGQVRKSEVEEAYAIHPLNVGRILGEYGYDDNVIAAGYLHDVVEDTSVTLEDIKMHFGLDIASLVESVTEKDKSLSWEARKEETIAKLKTMDDRQKGVACADKIDNIESLRNKFGRNGQKDFSAFKRGEEKQKWYYEKILESLTFNNKDNIMYERLRKGILSVFYEKEDDTRLLFQDNIEKYNRLKKLHAEKENLQRLKSVIRLDKPFVIEFTGTPRSGKTTTINNLGEFFQKGGFDTMTLKEFTASFSYKNSFRHIIKDLPLDEKNILILENVYEQLKNGTQVTKDIIIADRSINDRQIWNNLLLLKGQIDEEKYYQVRLKYAKLAKSLIDYLVILKTDYFTSLKRDYQNSLCLEERHFLNKDNILNYNTSLEQISPYLADNIPALCLLTTNMPLDELSLTVAENVMPRIRKRYLETFNNKYYK